MPLPILCLRDCRDCPAIPNEACVSNCRGLGNQPAVHGLLDLQKAEEPDILFLSKKIGREIYRLVEMEVQDVADWRRW